MTAEGVHTNPPPRILWIIPALVLIAAALSKASTPLSFLNELADYNFRFSLDLEAALVILIPLVEIVLGLSLLFWGYRWSAIAAIALLLIFSISIVLGIPQGYLQHCGCLGTEDLEPGMAIGKNVLMITLLAIGFTGGRRLSHEGNTWGACALVVGAVFPIPLILIPMSIIVLWQALTVDKKAVLLTAIGLAIGVAFHLLKLPLLIAPILGGFFFLIKIPSKQMVGLPILLISGVVFIANLIGIVAPAQPHIPTRYLNEGAIFPQALLQWPDAQDEVQQQRLILFLDPDCQTCKSLLPLARSLFQREGLPPLIALAPGTPEKLKTFAANQNLPFTIHPVAVALFEQAAPQTPLLIWVEADSIRHIFPEGGLPTPSSIEELLKHVQR
ncbi:MAG: hypothetical protein NTW14_00010 [bacterium]|nr:hypothetical protein [bacterium]